MPAQHSPIEERHTNGAAAGDVPDQCFGNAAALAAPMQIKTSKVS
jgi:hypothetical protein